MSEYYENIVDQVLETTTEKIISAAPNSYIAAQRSQKDVATVQTFVRGLQGHLNYMRADLLSAVRPLVESNIPSLLPVSLVGTMHLNEDDDDDDAEQYQDSNNSLPSAPVIASELTEVFLTLNKHMAIQLGLIVNADEAANNIVQQSIQNPHTSDVSKKHGETGSEILTKWLQSWFAQIEVTLCTEFDGRVHDAIQSIMEDFLIDD
ncbi:hypothetical protein DFQ28_002579 [Apophysomyces sp. BC1034]|nr:hypothetical protein DFQ30_004373 [Apophysomyces sp. BC1015]KAG0181746.1 hypothetical protein DFQ29_007177 [Apophysomyces sp. BC1021]KAG0193931.1 hypothetical protein DFQ28_002579 [Apophysomyces sp. BC1034]